MVDRRASFGRLPFVHFSVSVGEIKSAGAIVVASRHVVPLIWAVHLCDQPAVVNGIGILIRENPELRWRRGYHVALLAIDGKSRD